MTYNTPPVGPTGGAGVPAVQPTGALSWWSYFFNFIPIVGGLVWIITTIVQYTGSRDKGELARGNARNGLNWMISVIIYGIVLGILSGIIVAVTGSSTGSGFESTSPMLFLPYILVVALGICAIVFAIIGGLRAGKGQIYKAPLALNLIKG